MISFVRALSTTLLALVSVAAIACSGGDGGGSGGQGGGSSGGNGSGAGNSGSSSSGGDPPTGMQWAGTWSVDLAYDISCDFGFGNIKTASRTQTDTLVISDTGNGGVSVSFPNDVNYGMSGIGTDNLLTLSGQYPAKDDGGGAASISETENDITLKLDDISGPDAASGTISGMFNGQFGQDCTITAGTVSFMR